MRRNKLGYLVFDKDEVIYLDIIKHGQSTSNDLRKMYESEQKMVVNTIESKKEGLDIASTWGEVFRVSSTGSIKARVIDPGICPRCIEEKREGTYDRTTTCRVNMSLEMLGDA